MEDLEQWKARMEDRLLILEGGHKRLADSVILNNKQTDEMYNLFKVGKNGFIVLGKICDGIMWLGKKIYVLAKPLIVLFAIGLAVWHYLSTGVWDFKWPL